MKRKTNILRLMVAEKSRNDERREVLEIIAIGQEAWFTALRVIRFALAQVLLKGADGKFSFTSKQGKLREPHRSKGNLMQEKRGCC